MFYSTLVVAEAFGPSNQSQIADITNLAQVQATGNETTTPASIYHPSYVVYENGAPARAVLFNFVSDPSGASTYSATLSLSGTGALPSSVSVRYLQAASVAEHDNITWAGQTFGGSFASDGQLNGDEQVATVQCTNGQCVIPVFAPSIAVVYLTEAALDESATPTGGVATFATTVVGKGSATYNPAVLETSNGMNGPKGVLGSNSRGSAGSSSSSSGARRSTGGSWAWGLLGLAGAGLASLV